MNSVVKPEGVRNNNPLNIKANQAYEGMTSQVNGFAVFSSPVWGFRAAFRNYITKYDRGINTVSKLINEWAPPADGNNTNAYIQKVCSMTGYAPDEVIELKTWDVASSVVYAQTVVECGSFTDYFTRDQMAAGAFRAGIVDAPPPVTTHIVQKITGAGAAVGAAAAAVQGVAANSTGTVSSPKTQLILLAIAALCGVVAAVIGPKVVK
jgi:hypothetical protein